MKCARCQNERDGRHSYCRACRQAYGRERDEKMRNGTWLAWTSKRAYECSKTPKATRPASTADIAWAAGFLEGEGTFRCQRRCQSVSAGQANREPLVRLQAVFGGQISAPRQCKNNKPFSTWYANGARARGVMMTVYAHLTGVRRNQVRAALARSR